MMISPSRTRPEPLKFGQWLGLLGVVASLVLLWSLRQSLIYLFAALVLAMALCTLVGSIRSRLGCSRPLALLLSLGTVLLVLAVAATVVIPLLLTNSASCSASCRQQPKPCWIS